jgi:hypothetical protein
MDKTLYRLSSIDMSGERRYAVPENGHRRTGGVDCGVSVRVRDDPGDRPARYSNAATPVRSWPRMSEWMSWVPS